MLKKLRLVAYMFYVLRHAAEMLIGSISMGVNNLLVADGLNGRRGRICVFFKVESDRLDMA